MNRSEITKFISGLVKENLLGRYWASEVTYNWGTPDEGRVDFMNFVPENQTASGIDRGEFHAYEVKSCMADYNSGHGLNFIGDYNSIVCPMSLAKRLAKDGLLFSGAVGMYVPVSHRRNLYDEFSDPTPLDKPGVLWDLTCYSHPMRQNRKFSVQYLLFCMMRSGK